jgi:hypothetical protein
MIRTIINVVQIDEVPLKIPNYEFDKKFMCMQVMWENI